MYQIGTKVFYFDDNLKEELTIKESVVYGCFVSQKTGDLYYYLKEKQVPAFCVADTEDQIKVLLERFIAYRDDYIQRVEDQTARYNQFKVQFTMPELMDDGSAVEE